MRNETETRQGNGNGLVEEEEAVQGFKRKCAPPTSAQSKIRRMGTVNCGWHTLTEAWATFDHRWAIGARKELPESVRCLGGTRLPRDLFEKDPVDVFVVERGHIINEEKKDSTLGWRSVVQETSIGRRPGLIVESWDSRALLWGCSPVSKIEKVRWAENGYVSRYQVVRATQVGGAIRQERLLVVRIQNALSPYWRWDHLVKTTEQQERSMSNLLTPPGLVDRREWHQELPSHVHKILDHRREAMPWAYKSDRRGWICDEKRGYRRLSIQEAAKALGVNKQDAAEISSRQEDRRREHGSVLRTTSLFHWEYLSQSIIRALEKRKVEPGDEEGTQYLGGIKDTEERRTFDCLRDRSEKKLTPESDQDREYPEFHWAPPDLSEGTAWYRQRIANLEKAVLTYPPEQRPLLIKEGKRFLKTHRSNYDATGPKPTKLQVLWWEFPPEHWEAIRVGSKMNFMVPPAPAIHANGDMDAEGLRLAGEFVDELVSLGVLVETKMEEVITTAPLFSIDKPGQPGQQRIICNMKEGGQNGVSCGDPVYLNRAAHILSQMYQGGYSAVVDASKYFYQFRTHPADRPYLGTIHPVTGKVYVYCGLPMGATNSPAASCRIGQSFLRLLRTKHEVFGTRSKENTWYSGFRGEGYQSGLGYGIVIERPYGQPAVRLWVHVDDFLVHGPDWESTALALKLFLDTAVDVGLLCHPKKLSPPRQVQKYIGFLFDTRGIPTLCVPEDKRDKARCMVDYILNAPVDHEFSGLALSVVVGVLESLVEATPSRVGRTYVRCFHEVIHATAEHETLRGVERYCRCIVVPETVRSDLRWWRQILDHRIYREAYSEKSGTLIPTWGDGSGTGTGGTMSIPGQELQCWMGQWTPFVFHHSSNWKELKTLLLTLQQARDGYQEQVEGASVFYFTDNLVTYWVVANGTSKNPALHSLVRSIKMLELGLDCALQVVHVPGRVMIGQGTDGLSRGVWGTELHPQVDQTALTASVFAPLRRDDCVVEFLIRRYALPTGWRYQPWEQGHRASEGLHQFSVWIPPPEGARQCIIWALESWCESPLDTSAMFIVPRTIPGAWQHLSKYVVELETLDPQDLPLRHQPFLPTPVVVLYLRSHVRSLPNDSASDRMDEPAQPTGYWWHKEQVASLYGLSAS